MRWLSKSSRSFNLQRTPISGGIDVSSLAVASSRVNWRKEEMAEGRDVRAL